MAAHGLMRDMADGDIQTGAQVYSSRDTSCFAHARSRLDSACCLNSTSAHSAMLMLLLT